MTYHPIRSDALRDGVLMLGLPWYRSMPMRCVLDLAVDIDGVQVDARLPEHAPDDLWFVQDRIPVALPPVGPGEHTVTVHLRLLLPYLRTPAGEAIELPTTHSARITNSDFGHSRISPETDSAETGTSEHAS